MVHGTLMFDVDIERLTHALTPPADKLVTKGIASVKSRVANLKDHLPGITTVQELSHALERHLSRQYQDTEYRLTEAQLAAISHIEQSKFANPDWIYGRAPGSTVTHAKRLPCGNVEVHLEIKKGHIDAIRIGGDFIGNTPTTAIEERLHGCLYEHTALLQRLTDIDMRHYLDNTSTEAFVDLLFNQ